jgi:hypothetical protein
MEFIVAVGTIVAGVCFAAATVSFLLWLKMKTPVARSRLVKTNLRQRLRFGTTTMLAMMAVVALAVVLFRETKRTFLEGTWHGDVKHGGPQFADSSLLIHYDRMTLVEHEQAKTFRFEFPKRFRAEEIDLHGPDGLQLGLFSASERQLQLQIAAPGEPRPLQARPAASSSGSHFYLFGRGPP